MTKEKLKPLAKELTKIVSDIYDFESRLSDLRSDYPEIITPEVVRASKEAYKTNDGDKIIVMLKDFVSKYKVLKGIKWQDFILISRKSVEN